MPCYLRRQVGVKLTVKNRAHLLAALQANPDFVNVLDIQGQIIGEHRLNRFIIKSEADGTLEVTSVDRNVAVAIHKEYATHAMRLVSKKRGWDFQQNEDGGRITRRAYSR